MIMSAPLHSSWKAPVSMVIYNYVDASTEKGRGSTQDFKMFKIYRFVRTWVFFIILFSVIWLFWTYDFNWKC